MMHYQAPSRDGRPPAQGRRPYRRNIYGDDAGYIDGGVIGEHREQFFDDEFPPGQHGGGRKDYNEAYDKQGGRGHYNKSRYSNYNKSDQAYMQNGPGGAYNQNDRPIHLTSNSYRRRGGAGGGGAQPRHGDMSWMDRSSFIPFCNYFSAGTKCAYGNNCRYRHLLKLVSSNASTMSPTKIDCCTVGKLDDGQFEVYTISHERKLMYWNIYEDPGGLPKIVLNSTIDLQNTATACVFYSECLFCAFADGNILVLHRKSGDSRILTGHTTAVYSLLFVDNILISGGWDGTVRFWEFDSSQGSFHCIKVVSTGCYISRMKELSVADNNGNVIRNLWIAGSCLVILDLQKLEVSKTISTNRHMSVSLVKFEDRMVVGFAAGYIKTYDLTGNQLNCFSSDSVSCMEGLLVSGRPVLIYGTNEGISYVIGLPNFREFGTLKAHQGKNVKAIFDIGAEHWLSCGEDGSICVWRWFGQIS